MDVPNQPTSKTLRLPDWVNPFLAAWTLPVATSQDRMRLAIALSGENVRRGTGGPFAALVANPETAQIIAVGVNVVVPQRASAAHGEMMALLFAQEALGTHDLAAATHPSLELVTTSQPCVQCYGAIIWSGIRSVVVGARGSDVESLVGFDEGPVPHDWVGEWSHRGVKTQTDVLRDEACDVLRQYKASGALVYNSAANAAQA